MTVGGTSTIRETNGLLVAESPPASVTTTEKRVVVGWTFVRTSVASVPHGMLVKVVALAWERHW
jgi:hypothetical protein